MKNRCLALPFVFIVVTVVAVLAGCTQQQTTSVGKQGGASPFVEQAKATYVGSRRCGECHDKIFATWSGTLHSQVMQSVKDNPGAVKGDFVSKSATRTFGVDDIVITHGIQWKQRYIDKQWHILPAQWNFDSRVWAPYHPETWKTSDWRKECAKCHVVGYDTKTRQWKEFGIGCEACHGPGSAHSDNPQIGNIINPARLPKTLAGDICGDCHTRGKSPDGKWDFPIGYSPGDAMGPQNFTPVSYDTTKSWWPDRSAKEHRQQYIEWRETRHFRQGVDCLTCHTVHTQETKFATRLAGNLLCLDCHSNVSTDPVVGHAPILGAPQHSDCIGCHMPPTAKSADFGDERSHRFMVIQPRVTIALGGGDLQKQPNSCNLCHFHAKDSPAKLQRALDAGRRGAGRR